MALKWPKSMSLGGDPMPAEALYAALAFGGMFLIWVVLPFIVLRRHQTRSKANPTEGRNPNRKQTDSDQSLM
jgi:hypothetical protein